MATIDSNIAMGYRPVQLENPLNQLAAVTQIQSGMQGQQLNALKMQEYQRGLEEENKLRILLSGGNDINSPDVVRQMYGISPTKGLEFQKQQALIKKSGLETTGLELKNFNDSMSQFRNALDMVKTPEALLAWQDAIHKNPLIGPALANMGMPYESAKQQLMAELQKPGGFEAALTQSKLGATKFAELNRPQYIQENLGGTNRVTALPGLGIGAPTVISDTTKSKTFADITAEGNLAVNQKELANKYNPVLQANLAEAKAAGDYFGKNRAAAAQALPGALENATQAIRLIDEMVGTAEVKDKNGKVIQAAGKPHKGFSEYVGAAFIPGTRFLEGSDVASFELRQKQIEGKAFLEAFNTLRGGGAITEKEGEKGTLAIMRMNKASSEAEYKAAARELQEVLRTGINTMRAKAGQPSGGNVGGGSGGVDTSNPLLK
jgi:hypothetical protein